MSNVIQWLAAGWLSVMMAAAPAQDYPNKPVRWVAPFPPGGSADIRGRIIGQDLAKMPGQ